jgi:peptidoglycan/xylan/chitin deacetylase (PgdA/CDA1 family)
MSGIIYLLSNKDIAANTWDLYDPTEESSPLCLPEERKQLTSYFEIGSHCVHHMGLPSQSPEAQEKELKQSKRDLESEFSGPILSVAYPYGQRDSKTSTLAQNAGYLFGVNTDQGGRRWVDDPFSIFRVNIFPEETYFSLWKKTRAGYRDYFRRKRGR